MDHFGQALHRRVVPIDHHTLHYRMAAVAEHMGPRVRAVAESALGRLAGPRPGIMGSKPKQGMPVAERELVVVEVAVSGLQDLFSFFFSARGGYRGRA